MPGKMVGTVWGIERMHRAEGDERRYKGRCRYYCDEYCRQRATKCGGSAHCEYYEEINDNAGTTFLNAKKPFKGLKEIKMADILVPEHRFVEPSLEKLFALRDYYIENGQLDKPIIVSCKDDKYVLEDKYLRYYFAKQAKLAKIFARCGEKGCDKAEEPFRKVGARVKTSRGTGTITKVELQYVTVSFDDGGTMQYDLFTAVANKALLLIE